MIDWTYERIIYAVCALFALLILLAAARCIDSRRKDRIVREMADSLRSGRSSK